MVFYRSNRNVTETPGITGGAQERKRRGSCCGRLGEGWWGFCWNLIACELQTAKACWWQHESCSVTMFFVLLQFLSYFKEMKWRKTAMGNENKLVSLLFSSKLFLFLIFQWSLFYLSLFFSLDENELELLTPLLHFLNAGIAGMHYHAWFLCGAGDRT